MDTRRRTRARAREIYGFGPIVGLIKRIKHGAVVWLLRRRTVWRGIRYAFILDEG